MPNERPITRRKFLAQASAGAGTLAAFPLLAACGIGVSPKSQSTGGGLPDKVVIGALLSLTGAAAAFGTKARNSFDLRVKQINSSGGLFGNGKGIVELQIADDQSKPDVAIAEVARFAKDSTVSSIASLVSSAACVVASQEAERNRTVFVNTSSIDPTVNTRGFKYVFTTCATADGYTQACIDYTKEIALSAGQEPQRVGFVYEEKYAGPAYLKSFQKLFPKSVSWPVVGEYGYDPTGSDLAPVVSRLKADRVDLPVLSTYPQDAILLVNAMREQNYNPLAIVGVVGALPNVEFGQALGKKAEYVQGSAFFTPDIRVPGVAEFVRSYQSAYGIAVEGLAGNAYSGISVLLAAIKAARSVDRDVIRTTLGQLSLKPSDGIVVPDGVKFDATGANTAVKGTYYQWQKGEVKTVRPKQYATANAVYPRPTWDKIA